jgi:hypothetical protein
MMALKFSLIANQELLLQFSIRSGGSLFNKGFGTGFQDVDMCLRSAPGTEHARLRWKSYLKHVLTLCDLYIVGGLRDEEIAQ